MMEAELEACKCEAAEVLEKLVKLQTADSDFRKLKTDLEKQLEEVIEENQIFESEAVERKKRIRSLEMKIKRLETPCDNLWMTLLLPGGASIKAVHRQYRRLAVFCHSDKGGDVNYLPKLSQEISKEILRKALLRGIYIAHGLSEALDKRFQDMQPQPDKPQ